MTMTDNEPTKPTASLTRESTMRDLLNVLEAEYAAVEPNPYHRRNLNFIKKNIEQFERVFPNLGVLADKRNELKKSMIAGTANFLRDTVIRIGLVKPLTLESTSDDLAAAMLEANKPGSKIHSLTEVAHSLQRLANFRRREGAEPSGFYLGKGKNNEPKYAKNIGELLKHKSEAEVALCKMDGFGPKTIQTMFQFIEDNVEKSTARAR